MEPNGLEPIVDCLDLAWSHVGASTGDLDLPDPIAFADMRHAWPTQRLALAQRIVNGDTRPSDLEVIDFPKNELMVRPIARVSLESRLMYEASILAAVELIDESLSKSVYSYRWLSWDRRLYAPVGRWMRMFDEALSFHRANRNLMLLRTDISSFYENVEIPLLLKDLKGLNPPTWSLESLEAFLHSFNELNNVWGIPQGFDITGVLANLYLTPVDVALERRGLKHFRYSDDMLIFGPDWLSLRSALLEITSTLRERRLVLAGAKTEILDHDRIEDDLRDAQKNAINYGIAIMSGRAKHELHDFFDKAVSGSAVNKRNLTFSLTKLSSTRDRYALDWVLENIGMVPHASRECLSYIGKFHETTPDFEDRIAELLTNSKLSFYPFAQQNVLLYLLIHGVRNKSAQVAARSLLADRNTSGFVREFAARYLGRYGDQAEGAWLKRQFKEERDPKLRRALLVACYESGSIDKATLDIASKSDPDLRLTADYLRSLPRSIPLPSFERTPYGRVRIKE